MGRAWGANRPGPLGHPDVALLATDSTPGQTTAGPLIEGHASSAGLAGQN
jgi:hypothetical protein